MPSRHRTLTLLAVLCVGHVLIISSQVQSARGNSVLRGSAFGAVAAIQGGAAGLADGVARLWSGYVALVGVSGDNDELRQRILRLEGDLQAERARAARTTALEDALTLQRTLVAPTLAARVIAGNASLEVLTVTIDRGTADGVAANMAVIDARGVVGRVIGQPARSASIVQLLVDRAAAAGAFDEKTGAAGIVTGGFADGLLRMELVSSSAEIAVGERIVTSGQDGIYPPGFLIGHVSRVTGAGKAREVAVAPAVDFSHLEVVLVVLSPASQAGDPAKTGAEHRE